MTKTITPGGITRRHMLAWTGGTALALLFSQAILAAEPITLDQFMTLSGKLLDRDGASLVGEYGQSYLDALVADGQDAALAQLISGTADKTLENRIITGWYSGFHQTADGEAVVTYTDALMWEALDFTKPMGWCGGETGYWSQVPEGEA
ncbi:hypothetical protein JHC09_14415 [Devosia sp. MC532]|uniref:sugar dehydrogenase complex small subunit n=1 Tax=Devosia sp. MC532 TaxID=2799788 RepID=UPI0018F296D2|nr:sugar dehydrogenase complex small subunit [Devosia sp. MC532]MBJ7579074.1 hypothetical protein [Devosia sp. MC532]